MSVITDLRLKIVEGLGGKCSTCGWDRDPRILDIHAEDTSRKEYLNQNRGAYYLNILSDLASGKYTLICKNCKFSGMMDKRMGGPKPVEPQIIEKIAVWQTGLHYVEAVLGEYVWLKPYVEEGYTIYVVPSDKKVYRYMSLDPVEEDWKTFACYAGFPETLGDQQITVINVR